MDGIQRPAVLQFLGAVDGLLVRGAFQHLVAVGIQKRGADGVKGHHLGLGQLREEDGPVFAQHTCQQADLPRFLGTDEITSHIGGGGQRLEFGEPCQKTGGQRAVGKGYVGEPGRFHREVVRITKDHVLHDALGGTHDVHRVRGLIRGYAEVFLRRERRQQVKEALGMEDVVLEKGLHAVNVLLGADVLMGGEISHDVEAASVTEHLLKDRRREIHGIGDVIFRYIHTLCGAKIPGQFRQSVFVVIHHHQRRGLEWQQCLDEAGADGAGPADDEHRLSCDFFAEGVPVGLDVGAEHGHRAFGDVLTDKLV